MTGRRVVLAFAAGAAVAACRPVEPGDSVRGLSVAERARFDSGRVVFDSVFIPATGLGPLFNGNACADCHENPVSGGAGVQIERHASAFRPDGPGRACDELVAQGGPVFQDSVTPALRSALGIDREAVPAAATGTAIRTSPDLFGFGLLDAVPDSVILALADPDDRDGDGVSGRPNRFFDGRLGRFGRKALVPTLREFNDGAFQIEQGITTPAVPDEGTVGGLPFPSGTDPTAEPELDGGATAVNDAFVRMLAPPAPLKPSPEAQRGRDVFARIGCTACHVPTLRTGDNPIAALRHKEVAAYTDLLLHDMGPELGDICFALATPREFRTEPLMGLRLMTRFLHDGRASTVEEAIELHGGEGMGARNRFLTLPAADRAALIAFLRTL